jgi:hypothetical protein
VTLPGAFRALNGDHIGTEISQRLDTHRAEKEMVETDDADALQKVEHRNIITVEENAGCGNCSTAPQALEESMMLAPADNLISAIPLIVSTEHCVPRSNPIVAATAEMPRCGFALADRSQAGDECADAPHTFTKPELRRVPWIEA